MKKNNLHKTLSLIIISVSAIAFLCSFLIIFNVYQTNKEFKKHLLAPKIVFDKEASFLQESNNSLSFFSKSKETIGILNKEDFSNKEIHPPSDPENIFFLQLSPNEKYITYTDEFNSLYLADPLKNTTQLIVKHVDNFIWSRDSSKIIISTANEIGNPEVDDELEQSIYIYSIKSKNLEKLKSFTIDISSEALNYRESWEDNNLIVSTDDGFWGYTFSSFDLNSKNETDWFDSELFTDIKFSPTGKNLIYTQESANQEDISEYTFHNLETKEKSTYSFPLTTANYDWSPDESFIIYIKENKNKLKYIPINKLNLENGEHNIVGYLNLEKFNPSHLYITRNNKIIFQNILDNKLYMIDL